MTEFTLTIVTSSDGLIARAVDHPPQAWASAEEQVLFYADIEAADWVVLGRHTHVAADRPDRHRIVFSRALDGWQRPTQLWIDPKNLTPRDLAPLVAHVRPLRRGLVLGGTRVHDWFHRHGALSTIHLTVEPVTFGSGLPIFSGQRARDPIAAFEDAGYRVATEIRINEAGTRYVTLVPAG